MSLSADYRQTIKSAYALRREKNPSYSLRSFARDLEVSTSMLSEVLNYKKNLTRKTAVKINKALKLPEHESKIFFLAVDMDSPSVAQSRENIQDQINQRSSYGKSASLSEEDFSYISDPKHLVLLALISMKGFKNSLSWIANKIGVFQHQVNTLLGNLQKLEVIEIDAAKKIRFKKQYVYTSDGEVSKGIREFHRSSLNHAIQAIETIPVQERDYCTMIIAVDQKDFKEMQNDVREFQNQMYKKYSKKPTADRVYAIQNQLIPYTSRSNSEISK